VTGSAAVIASSEEDLTQFWHALLGHMCEKGMTTPTKRGLLGSQGAGKLVFYDHCVFEKTKES